MSFGGEVNAVTSWLHTPYRPDGLARSRRVPVCLHHCGRHRGDASTRYMMTPRLTALSDGAVHCRLSEEAMRPMFRLLRRGRWRQAVLTELSYEPTEI
jgi:hypothetical protein